MSMNPERNLFKEYPSPCYVETGVWLGDSIDLALQAGFPEIHGIEIDHEKAVHAVDRFKDHPVIIYEGDSAEILHSVIQNIRKPITFWLDSHWQMLEGEDPGPHPWPLFYELNAINVHPVKTHTIIIDDILYLTHPDVTGWTKKMIEEKILKINPKYKIEYFANPVINNILVAHI